MNSHMLLGGLGGRELILIAAIALLLAGVRRLAGLQRARSIELRTGPRLTDRLTRDTRR